MPKIFNIYSFYARKSIYTFLACILFFSLPILGCDDSFCNGSCGFIDQNYEDFLDATEELDYTGLGDYEEMLLEFDQAMDAEDIEVFEENHSFNSLDHHQKGFVKKWCRKLKRWVKKQLFKLIKLCVRVEKGSTPDAAARTILQFKKKIDKVYGTGSVEKIISLMEKKCPKESRDCLDVIIHEIRKEAYGKSYTKSFSEACPRFTIPNGDNFSDITWFAFVEMGCGALIMAIPTPVTETIGFSILSHGLWTIIEECRDDLIENSHRDSGKYEHYDSKELDFLEAA